MTPDDGNRRWALQVAGFLPCLLALVIIQLGGGVTAAGSDGAGTPTAEVVVDDGRKPAEFRIHGLNPETLAKIAADATSSDQWKQLVPISIGSGRGSAPPMLGSYRISGRDLTFTPRYPLDQSIATYTVEIDAALLAPSDRSENVRIVVDAKHVRDRADGSPKTSVEAVYPSRGVLPENTLKFYIAFSSPMSRGDAYDHIRLLDGSGRPIVDPFLELGEELWSADGKRFTLLFDPGRIKRGLKPREEVGPVLEAGRRYTLVIEADWLDARGRPLGKAFRKPFRVEVPDEIPPDPRNWKIHLPRAGFVEPLVLRFPESLDRALAERLIVIQGTLGQEIDGVVHLDSEETAWKFTPRESWSEGPYEIVVGTDLEDLAGNSVGRRFEVDTVGPITESVRESTVTIPFRIGR